MCSNTGVTSTIHHNIFLGGVNMHAQSGELPRGNAVIYNNTFYGTANHSTNTFDALQSDAATAGATIQFQHNIVYAVNGYDAGGGDGRVGYNKVIRFCWLTRLHFR